MNFRLKKNLFSKILISLIVVFSPVNTYAAQLTEGQIASKASSDCTTLTAAKSSAVTAAKAAYAAVFEAGGTANAALSVPVSDAGVAATTASTAGDTQAANTWTSNFKLFGDCVVYKTGQLILDNFTEQTIAWIKGGMNGSPHYAIDPRKLESDLVDSVAGNLIYQIESVAICDFNSLFKNDLKNWVIQGNPDPAPRFRAALRCPFKATKASDFYRGAQTFAWKRFETALNDNGNPYGIKVLTDKELTAQQKAASERAKQQLNWDSGFLSVVDDTDLDKCNWPDKETKDSVAGTESLEVTNADGTISYIQPDPLPEAQKKALSRQYCPKVTPGKLIETQLSKTTGVAFDRLGLADNISKIISALVTKVSQDALEGIFKKL